MARGLDKETPGPPPPKRDPFRQKIASPEELEAERERQEDQRLQKELESARREEVVAIDKEAEEEFREIEKRVQNRLEEIRVWAQNIARGRALSKQEIEEAVKEDEEEIRHWEMGAKKDVNVKRNKAIQAAQEEAARQDRIKEEEAARQAKIKKEEVRLSGLRKGTKKLLEKAGVSDFSPGSVGKAALDEAGFHPEEYETIIRYTDPVLEAEGKSHIALVYLQITGEEEEKVFEEFFGSEKEAQKASKNFIQKTTDDKLKNVKKREYTARTKKAQQEFAEAVKNTKERREATKLNKLKDLQIKKEAEYKETLKGLDLKDSSYTGSSDNDSFLTDPSQVKNLKRETIGDYDIVTWNQVPHRQAGLVLFYKGKVYARTRFADKHGYKTNNGTGFPYLRTVGTSARDSKLLSPSDDHQSPLATLLPGLSKRRLLRVAKEHISEEAQRRLQEALARD